MAEETQPAILNRSKDGSVAPIYYKSECRPKTELREEYNKHKFVHRFQHLDRWLDERDRLRKDLYYLLTRSPQGAYPGGEIPLREMCEVFVKKNFDGVYHKGYTLADMHNGIERQHEFREREALLLAPRGSTKSCINVCDTIQWLLNAPDCKISILTGELTLAEGFMKMVKAYFYLAPDAKPTYFQAMFPEYILEGMDGTSNQPFRTPARVLPDEKEPSVWVKGITANLAGWRCDIKKGDDVITDQNCNTPETREEIKYKYDGTENLVGEWGFSDHIGTRYFEDDWYGQRLTVSQEDAPLKVVIRRAWEVKPAFVDVKLKDLKEEMVDLWFPSKLTWKSLRRDLATNEQQFRCQKLNDPTGGGFSINFTKDDLEAQLITLPKIPRPFGDIFISWDPAWSANKKADYSVGAVGMIKDRNLYILEIVYGHFGTPDLLRQIVALHRKYQAKLSIIERCHAWENLAQTIQQIAMPYGDRMDVMWPVDGRKNAKHTRVRGLEVMLGEKRLWFVDGEWIDDTFRQFVRYDGKATRRTDDIPDAISFLQTFIKDEVAPVLKRKSNAELAEEVRKQFAAQQAATSGLLMMSQDAMMRPVQHGFGDPLPSSTPPVNQPTTEVLSEGGPGWMLPPGMHL